ncbi:MAG: MBL fold metallo-hydrolase [Cyanobacteria bacterium P01_A01_bin.3]
MSDRPSSTDTSLTNTSPPEGAHFRLLPLLTGQEGYSYWLEVAQHAILLDVGGDWDALSARLPRTPDAVILSHAHADVAGGLSGLMHCFPNCPIYATMATFEGLGIGMGDRANRQALAFRQPVSLRDDLFLTLEPAGHLPGAAVTILTVANNRATPLSESDANTVPSIATLSSGRTCIVTGDCALTASRFQPGLPLAQLRQWNPEVLVVGGALGAQKLPARKGAESSFMQTVQAAIAAQRTVLLPVPETGIAQELLFAIASNSRFRQGSSRLRLWLDDAISAGCDRYRDILPHLPKSIRNYARDRSLFIQDGKRLSIAPLPVVDADRQAVLQSPGIVLCHAAASAEEWDAIWRHLIPDRTLYLRLPEVELEVPIGQWPSDLVAGIQVSDESWHSLSDLNSLKQIVHTLKPQHLVFTHGREKRLQELAQLPEFRDRYLTYAPQSGDEMSLNLAAIEASDPVDTSATELPIYEGEADETICIHTGKIEGVEVRLPPEVMDDARWDTLSETGLVTARWENDCLVIRGVSSRTLQQESFSFGADKQHERGAGDCSGCAYYARVSSAPNAKPQCTQPSSPLYGVTVSPQGSCPDFKPVGQ